MPAFFYLPVVRNILNINMIGKIYLTAFLIFLTVIGCVNKKEIKVDTEIKPVNVPKDLFRNISKETPDDFIKKEIPDSKLLLNSVVKFSYEHPEKLIEEDVKDFSVYKDKLVFLKNSNIFIPGDKCNNILLDKNYTNIQYVYPYVLAYNNDFFEVFDVNLCGSILKKIGQFQFIKLIPPYIYFYYDKNLNSINFLTGKKIFDKNFENHLMFIGGSKNFVFTVDSVGSFILFDVIEKEPIFKDELDENIVKWNSVGFDFYGINDKNELTIYNLEWKNNEFHLNKIIVARNGIDSDCVLSSNSFCANCNNQLIGKNTYRINRDFEKFYKYVNYLYGMINKDIYIVDISKSVYVKSVDLTKIEPCFCVKNDILYFNDLDGNTKSYDFDSNMLEVAEIPDNCTLKPVVEHQIVKYSDNMTYMFAEEIKSASGYSLFKRQINDDVYFYYEKN